MEKILELIKGEVCMGTYGLVELELRKLVEGQKPTTNSDMVPCPGAEYCDNFGEPCYECARHCADNYMPRH